MSANPFAAVANAVRDCTLERLEGAAELLRQKIAAFPDPPPIHQWAEITGTKAALATIELEIRLRKARAQ